jgi:PAS domain S-box-containing protein
MKLAMKGLLVVGVPLIFQIITVSVLAVLLWQAQELAAREEHAKDIIYTCNHTAVDIGNTIQAVFRSNRATGLKARNLGQEDVDQVRNSVQGLQNQLRGQPEEARNVERLTKFTEQFLTELVETKDAQLSKDEAMHASSDLHEFRLLTSASHLISIFKSTVALENRTHPEQPEKKQAARQLIRLWLLAAVLITVLVALGLAYFCSITIRKPLERMVKNALRISTRQPLEPQMKGADELANLDRVLHSVNAAIEEALTSERNLINYAADLVFSVDRQGKFLSVNPFSKTMLGYEPDELVGTSVFELIAPENRDQVVRAFNSNYKGRDNLLFETKMQDREKEPIETSLSVIYSPREKIFFCVAHNITERKHVERLKQDFIAMISHDLRTPLMSVSSSINLVQSGATGEITEIVENELNCAERSVDHLIELVNDLLDFEKLEAGRMNFEFVPIPINEVIEESIRLVQALATEKKVAIESPSDFYTIAGDQRKLIQVTVNLLSNALKHSPQGGVIKVQTRSLDGMLEVAIHDQGPGVPDQYAEQIFAPFEQISHRATAALGTGLGLAICKLVVEAHGGKVAVRPSEILPGSAFWFTLRTADAHDTSPPTLSSVAVR